MDNLRQSYLPVLYSPVAFGSEEELLRRSFRVRADGSIRYDLLSRPGLTYEAASLIPTRRCPSGNRRWRALSDVRRRRRRRGVFDGSPVLSGPDRRPAAAAAFLELPELDPRIERAAEDLTAGATTEFEKGVLLERFFRDKELFTYTVDIDPGHSAEDLADWLFTGDSPNYRKGYCEQFATAMVSGQDGRRAQPGCARVYPRRDRTGRRSHGQTRRTPMPGSSSGWTARDGSGSTPPRAATGANPATTADMGFDPFQFVPEEGASEAGATPGNRRPSIWQSCSPAPASWRSRMSRRGSSVAVVAGSTRCLVVVLGARPDPGDHPGDQAGEAQASDGAVGEGTSRQHGSNRRTSRRLGQPGSRVPDAARGCRRCGTAAAELGRGLHRRHLRAGGLSSGEVGRAVESMRSTERHLQRTHTRWQRFLGWLRP